MRPLAILFALVLAGPATAACRTIVVRDTGTGRAVKVKVCGGPWLAKGRF